MSFLNSNWDGKLMILRNFYYLNVKWAGFGGDLRSLLNNFLEKKNHRNRFRSENMFSDFYHFNIQHVATTNV